MEDGHDDFTTQRPSAIVATTVITLVVAASAVLWRNHSKDDYTRAESFKPHGNAATEHEAGSMKPARSKERRRRGKDPMKELMKGGKKAKELNKLINSISLHATSPSSRHPSHSPSRDFDPSSDHDHRDASVSSFKSTSSQAEHEHEHELEDTSLSMIMPNSSTLAPRTLNNPHPPSGDIPLLTMSATTLSDYSVFSTTNMGHDKEPNYSIIHHKHGHSMQPRHSRTPSLPFSRSPFSSIRDVIDRGEGTSNVTPVSTSGSPVEGALDPLSSTMRAIDPSTSVKRGRKRNKSPASRNGNAGGDSKASTPVSSTQVAASTITDRPQSPPPLSTQTQLASLRGALQAARLREEKTRHEIEVLRWEAQLAKRRETEYHAYMNYLTHQLHSYASFVAATQAPGRHLHPSGSYSHEIHGPSAAIGSSRLSTLGPSFTTDQGPLPLDTEISHLHGSPSSASLVNDQCHPTPGPITPITSLPSPPSSDTVSSPTHPSMNPLPSSRSYTQSQTYTNSHTVKLEGSVFPPESPDRTNISSNSVISPQAQLLSPPSTTNSPLPPQLPFVSPPIPYEATMDKSYVNFSPVNYYPDPLFQGSNYSAMTMPLTSAYAPTFFEQESGRNEIQSKGKGNKKTKDKREKGRVSIKDERVEQPQSTTFYYNGELPSPTTPITQFDANSFTSCKRDPSDCSSSPSSSLPSTPSSRSRSHHSPRSDQLPKTLVMPETLPAMTPQPFSPLETLGLSMERIRDNNRGRAKSSFVQLAGPPSCRAYYDHHNGEYYGAGINESGREDGEGLIHASGYGISGFPNMFYGSGSSNGDDGIPYDDEGGPLSGMLADAILKRPEAMRMGATSRISDRERPDAPGAVTMKEGEREISAGEEEARKLPADPILEFTFPSLSNWGRVQPGKGVQCTHEDLVEKTPSSPPPTPPVVRDELPQSEHQSA